jgi:signal transduction histidine kinase
MINEKKPRILTRIISGYIFLLLFFIIVSVFYLISIKGNSKIVDEIIRHPNTVSNAALMVNVEVNAIHRLMEDVVLAESEVQLIKELEKIDSLDYAVLEKLQIIKNRYLGNLDDVLELENSFNNWKLIRQEVIHKVRSNKEDDAFSITVGKGVLQVNLLNSQTKKIIDFAFSKILEYENESQNSLKTQYVISVIFVLIAFFLILIAITIAYQSVNKPLRDIADKIRKISKISSNSIISEKEKNILEIIDFAINDLETKSLYLQHEIEDRTAANEKLSEDKESLKIEIDDATKKLRASLEELKTSEQNLIIALKKANESDRLKSSFLANVSHEIRTPLNSILGFSDLICDPDEDEESKLKYKKIVISGGNQLLAIIDGILSISLIEAGQLNINKGEFSINNILDSLHTQYSVQTELSEVNIKLDKNSDIILESDENKIKQVLVNLISNAIKYTKEGEVKFGFKVIKKKVQFYVKDTGRGIPQEFQEKIFERFFRIEDKAHYISGTGLGLSICLAIVSALEGEIWCDSEVGSGSTFHFTIQHNQENRTILL